MYAVGVNEKKKKICQSNFSPYVLLVSSSSQQSPPHSAAISLVFIHLAVVMGEATLYYQPHSGQTFAINKTIGEP